MAEIDTIIRDTRQGGAFCLPGALCREPFGSPELDGHAQKLLMVLFWLSTERDDPGDRPTFRVPLVDLRVLTGVTSHKSNTRVRASIAQISSRTLADADGQRSRIFDLCEADVKDDCAVVDWRVSATTASLLHQPATYGLVDIRTVARLRKSLDVVVYRRASLVRRMRIPRFYLDLEEVGQALGAKRRDTKRLSENVRRAVARVNRAGTDRIEMAPWRERGSRRHSGFVFDVRSPSPTDLPSG